MREASQGRGLGPQNIPSYRLTMGLSCLVPASPASSGLPVPSGPFDCPHLFAHGVQRLSSGSGPSFSLGSSNFHPWLFVSVFYPIHECWVSKDFREDGVQTPCPVQIRGVGELRLREGKGQAGGRTGPGPVVFPNPCWLTLWSPGSLCPQMSRWGSLRPIGQFGLCGGVCVSAEPGGP